MVLGPKKMVSCQMDHLDQLKTLSIIFNPIGGEGFLIPCISKPMLMWLKICKLHTKKWICLPKFWDLEKNMVILDLACGQGRHSLELARRGFKNVNGLDRSHFLIRKAKNISTN